MKPIELIDLIRDSLTSGDNTQELKGKYHPEVIRKHIAIAYEYIVSSAVYPKAEKTNNWGLLDSFIKSYVVPVKYDTEREEKYSVIPASYISMPQSRGIRMISPKQGQDYSFMYRFNNSENLFGNLDVSHVSSIPRFYPEGNKVYYSEHLTDSVKEVLMKLVVNFDEWDDDENISLPTGYEKQVRDMTLEVMARKGHEKTVNDNNANTK